MSVRRSHIPILFPALSLLLTCVGLFFYMDYGNEYHQRKYRAREHLIRLPRHDSISVEKIQAQLEQAFASHDSVRQLERFFSAWHNRYRSNADEACRNDTLEAAYSFFEQTYDPAFSRIPIQNELIVYILPVQTFDKYLYEWWGDELFYLNYIRIVNFRPRISLPDTRYLTPEYNAVLVRFPNLIFAYNLGYDRFINRTIIGDDDKLHLDCDRLFFVVFDQSLRRAIGNIIQTTGPTIDEYILFQRDSSKQWIRTYDEQAWWEF